MPPAVYRKDESSGGGIMEMRESIMWHGKI